MDKRYTQLIWILSIGIALFALSALPARQALGQDSAEPAAPSAALGGVGFSMPVQGRLTDASGYPLDGHYDLTFRLYTGLADPAAVCEDTNTNVDVANGLFSTYIWGDCGSVVTGQQLYLGIQVGADAEMTPRLPVYPVPYAASLMPGAVISSTISGLPVLHLENSAPTGRGLRAYATATTGVNYAVIGASKSPSGYGGYFYNNGGGIGLWSWTNSSSKPAIFGCVNASSGACASGSNPAGVLGKSSLGDGVQGVTSSSSFRGVYAENTGGIALAAYSSAADPTNHTLATLYLIQSNSSGDYVVGASSYFGSRTWRVDRTGKGFFNGGTQASGADFAEQIAVQGDEGAYEVGDVLVISAAADRMVEKSNSAFSRAVIGVYSSDPAVLAGAPDQDSPLSGVPVAVVGIVKCKVSTENGPIQRGDLLVTASLPGYAMRSGDNPPQGTVLGKALQTLDAGTGLILILVVLQ